MSDIKVALTTSKFMVVPGNILLQEDNIPICVATIGLGMFGFPSGETERQELILAEICVKSAKAVFVDPDTRHVFIGEDPEKPDTSLVDYIEEFPPKEYAREFFKRWQETKCMVLEFQMYNPISKSYLFAVSGFWLKNFWQSIEIIPTPKIGIV